MTTGEKIKFERLKAGYTQEQLAEKLLVSRQAITKWESGRGVPDIENLRAIAAFFNLSVDDLLNPNGKKKSKKKKDEKKEKTQNFLLIISVVLLLVAVILVVILFGNGKLLFGATNGSMAETSSKDTSSIVTSYSTSSEDSSSQGPTSLTPGSSSYTPTPPTSSGGNPSNTSSNVYSEASNPDSSYDDYNDPPQDPTFSQDPILQYFEHIVENNEVTITYCSYRDLTKELIVPETIEGYPVTKIAEHSMRYVQAKSIILPETVTFIEWYAFADTNTHNLYIPDGVKALYGWTFGEASITNLYLGSGIETIDTEINVNCGLDNIYISSENETFEVKNNCLIEKSTGTVFLVGDTDRIPDGVTKIADRAICNNFTKIYFPKSLVEIGDLGYAIDYFQLSKVEVYYEGTEQDRAQIIFSNNSPYLSVSWHYNSY